MALWLWVFSTPFPEALQPCSGVYLAVAKAAGSAAFMFSLGSNSAAGSSGHLLSTQRRLPGALGAQTKWGELVEVVAGVRREVRRRSGWLSSGGSGWSCGWASGSVLTWS